MSHESTQQMLVKGHCEDIYYPSEELTKKECLRTKQNTKFVQSLTQLGSGTSIFTIPPNFGIQDVIIQMQLPDLTGANTGLAVPRGWGYAMIKQISYRVSGSSQYYVTGEQLLQHALRRCADSGQRDDLFALGGQYLTGGSLASASNYAYVWLDLPWTRPTSEGKPCPLPSDVLASQIVVTVEMKPLSAIFSVNGVGPSPVPTALASAQFQVQQVTLENRSDSLGAKVDMATHSLNYPCEFVQQEISISGLQNSVQPQTITATGFKSGSLKEINMWLSRRGDETGVTKNPLRWYAPQNIVLTYAGDQYCRFDAGSSQLWNLVNSKFAPRVAGLTVGYAGGYNTTPENYGWVTLPLAQTFDSPETSSYMLVEGLQVTNGIVNIQFSLPFADGTNDWVLHLSYVYASTLVFSQNTCEFAF